jgi:hypothetical protein
LDLKLRSIQVAFSYREIGIRDPRSKIQPIQDPRSKKQIQARGCSIIDAVLIQDSSQIQIQIQLSDPSSKPSSSKSSKEAEAPSSASSKQQAAASSQGSSPGPDRPR